MAFVNTKITSDMVKKYDMEKDYNCLKNICDFFTYGNRNITVHQISFRNLERLELRIITINEDNDCYLRYGGSVMPDVGQSGHNYYLFYINGKIIYFTIVFKKLKPNDK